MNQRKEWISIFWGVILCLFLVGASPALAGMSLMADDALSDVAAQTGLSLALKMRMTDGHIMLNTTRALDLQGLQFRNYSDGVEHWGMIGNTGAGIEVDIGSTGGRTILRFQFPNGFADTTYVPTMYANTVAWSKFPDSGGPVQTVLGSLTLANIYQNQISYQFWGKSDGLSGIISLNMQIGEYLLNPDRTATTGNALSFQYIFISSAPGGTQTAPSRGTDYALIGLDTNNPTTIDCYTSAAGGTFSMMRWDIPVRGSIRVKDVWIGGTGRWHDYGAVVFDYINGGFVRMTFPYMAGENWFAPDT